MSTSTSPAALAAASRHLKVLVDAGLIVATRRRGWTYYRRNDTAIAAAARIARL